MLLEAVIDDAWDAVMRVVGVEAERELPFAGLWSLVLPLLAHEEALTPLSGRHYRWLPAAPRGLHPGGWCSAAHSWRCCPPRQRIIRWSSLSTTSSGSTDPRWKR